MCLHFSLTTGGVYFSENFLEDSASCPFLEQLRLVPSTFVLASKYVSLGTGGAKQDCLVSSAERAPRELVHETEGGVDAIESSQTKWTAFRQ
jgi:hypothetical protein